MSNGDNVRLPNGVSMPGRFESRAHPLLEPYVRAYWGVVRDRMPAPFVVTPDCFVEVMIFAEPPIVRARGVERRLPRCFVIPLLDEQIELVMDRPVRCVAIRLHGSCAAFVSDPAGGCAPGAIAGSSAPREFIAVAPAVLDALDRDAWPEIVATFDRILLDLLGLPRSDEGVRALANAFLSAPCDSPVSMAEVARRLGRSRRQIERSVRALTNRSPRQLAGLARFQFVRDALWERPEVALDDLAAEAGYADQSHLSREFRRYAGTTPGAFRRACLGRRAESVADVAFVQEARRERG